MLEMRVCREISLGEVLGELELGVLSWGQGQVFALLLEGEVFFFLSLFLSLLPVRITAVAEPPSGVTG